MPSLTSLTDIFVFLDSSSARRLWCLGSRCWIRTKAMPVSLGRFATRSANASIPPAEAPIATISNPSSGLRVVGSFPLFLLVFLDSDRLAFIFMRPSDHTDFPTPALGILARQTVNYNAEIGRAHV